MRSTEPSDPELLADWLEHQREPAFRSLVARYAGLVHMTAKRTCGDDSIATEATQLTFIALAQKAKSLTNCASLAGWLHRTAMMQARNLLRKSQRENRKLEQLAMETQTPSHDETWREMQPVLDDALASLSDKDREALLLRFYRSLTICEIAATLGIATSAAQKRIDRATERLRGKLTRRGVRTGGSFGATLLAGFCADAQAALPISVLASKAVAAGAACTTAVSTFGTFFTATAMKATSIALPLVALLAAGSWIATQRRSIARLEQQCSWLETCLATDTSGSPGNEDSRERVRAAKTGLAVDWRAVAAQMRETLVKDKVGFIKLKAAWNLRLSSMSRDKLITALDEIAALEIPSESRNLLEEMLVESIMLKDPELVLERFGDRLQNDQSWIFWHLTNAISEWAKRDPEKAAAWLDQRIANGHLDAITLDGRNPARLKLEVGLLSSLIVTDPVAAMCRIRPLPDNQRLDVLKDLSHQHLPNDSQAAFADLVRQHVSKEAQARLIAEHMIALPSNSYYTEVLAFMDTIHATPAERAACIERAVEFGIESTRETITTEDLKKLHSFAQEIADESRRNRILGKLK